MPIIIFLDDENFEWNVPIIPIRKFDFDVKSISPVPKSWLADEYPYIYKYK